MNQSIASLPALSAPNAIALLQRLATGLLLVLAAMLLAGPAQAAGQATTSFSVTASVLDSCSVSATDLAFGTYDPFSNTDKTGSSSISVRCSLGTLYNVSLDNGANASGSTRRMANGAYRLTYQVYRDTNHSLIFGTLAALLGVSGVGTGLAIPTTVYGVIPKNQNVGTGSYADQVTVTVDY